MDFDKKTSFSIATYNVLCDSYIKPQYYPKCHASALLPENRHPRVLERIAGLDTDVICLQEVDYAMFDRLQRGLLSLGYRGRWAHKGELKSDGCATFVRKWIKLLGSHLFTYNDGNAWRNPSGHVALITMMGCGDEAIMVVNTHLKWDSLETPVEKCEGLAQAQELLALSARSPHPHVICGDFNAERGSVVMDVFAEAGYLDAHLGDTAPSCVANGRAQRVDGLLCNERLWVEDWRPASAIDEKTSLPSGTEPSDHVPLCATLTVAD